MPVIWPLEPRLVNSTERRVWEALSEQLGPDDLLLSNVRLNDQTNDCEIDCVVVLDGGGAVVIEIKGGQVSYEDGGWRQSDREGGHSIDPVEQAVRGKHMFLRWLASVNIWAGRPHIRWAHAVCFPDVEVPDDFSTPDLPRAMILDRRDLKRLPERLREIVAGQDTTRRFATVDDVYAIHGALDQRMIPQKQAVTEVENHDDVIDRLTEQQSVILNAIRLLDRVEVRGGAGSGKTWLAVEQARRLTRQGQRVALVSYSRGLAAWMQRRASTFDRKDTPAYVGTFHGLGDLWGAPEGSDDDSDYWEHRLPALMIELAGALPIGKRFDAIVIDEAQDFADSWWPAAMAALKDDGGGIFAFTDEGQRIFSRFGATPAGLVPLVLDKNLRNTKQISATFSSMAPNRMRVSDYEGAEVRFVESPWGEACDRADDMVDTLLDEGWQPSDIAVLATGHKHPEQANRQAGGHEAYWDSFWDDDQVFYGHVMGFKGLERPVVILAINEKPGKDRAKERLYVGLSRARDLLVVCGDSTHIEDVGGPAVLKKLRAGEDAL